MNKFDFISYEIRKKFVRTLYEARMKLTVLFYVQISNKFHVISSYGYMVSNGLHMNEPPGPS